MNHINSPAEFTDGSAESEIKAKGLTAPRVKPEDLDANVASVQYHVFENSQLTVCCITMLNGFTVTGTSACADPKNFDKELGEKIAFAAAKNQMWPLLGYLLKEHLFKEAIANQIWPTSSDFHPV